jgi:regulator of sigma E protease
MPGLFTNVWNILLMVIGFSLVIVVHEGGHFLAARWAKIRVHAFAVGFGPAIVSWRKGLGFRAGSSEKEYAGLLADEGKTITRGHVEGVSETEYRLNWVPFGGYVRMLGQEDGKPGVTSDAPDSYASKPVWKRMIVISGGVIMNVILAAVIFAVALLAGMKEVPPVVGAVAPDSPAAAAGFEPGDIVLSADGRTTPTFTDISIASAMSGPDSPVEFGVLRGEKRLTLTATPKRDASGLKAIGVAPAYSTTLRDVKPRSLRPELVKQFERAGLSGVQPGMEIVSVEGKDLKAADLPDGGRPILLDEVSDAVASSGGKPVPVTFRDPKSGETLRATIDPAAEYQRGVTSLKGEPFPFDHLLGLTPLMKVVETQERGEAQGLRAGDVLLEVGDVVAPPMAQAIATIRDHAGKTIRLSILREGKIVEVDASVGGDGVIGFAPGQAFDTPIIAATPEARAESESEQETSEPLSSEHIEPALAPGTRIISVDGIQVSSFADIRGALQHATEGAFKAGTSLTVELTGAPATETDGAAIQYRWALTPAEIKALHGLGWRIDPELEAQFQYATITVQAANPWQGIVMGVQKTNRIMTLTYLTFKRLIQGTVSPNELRGPVGITHIGSQYAAQGFVYFLFFLALISANLAVINFLPIPVVDGGLFVMLLYEGITRRPVPMVIQNVATAVGLALIITAFIYVTINDISRLF